MLSKPSQSRKGMQSLLFRVLRSGDRGRPGIPGAELREVQLLFLGTSRPTAGEGGGSGGGGGGGAGGVLESY